MTYHLTKGHVMTFSEVLNKYKSDLKLTQSALAEICGTSPAVISRYLNGKRLPEKNSEIIKNIANGIADKSKDFPDLTLSPKDIEKELNDSLVSDDKENDFYSKLDSLLKDKTVSNTELSKVLPYDSSYISRVRNKKRIPKDQDEFLSLLENYLKEKPKSEPKKETKAKTKAVSKAETEPETKTKTEPKIESAKLIEFPKEATEKSLDCPDYDTKKASKKPRQTRFEYFLEKVSSYIENIRNFNLPL